MKYFTISIVTLFMSSTFICYNILAQQFTEQTNISLTKVDYCTVDWGDYDNDDDLDILVSGRVDGNTGSTKIYRNDGNNIFTAVSTPFPSLYRSSVDWGDYDNDGDLDVALCGFDVNLGSSKIYENLGNGTFQLKANLLESDRGSVRWGDYDNDGDLDLLLTGEKGPAPSDYITRVYKNNNGNFIELNHAIPGVYTGGAIWGDIDNDLDLDIFLFGSNSVLITTFSDFYLNDGVTFTAQNSSLVHLYSSSADFGDFDNDGDLDLVFSGCDGPSYLSKIYQNDNGMFSDFNASLTGHTSSSVAWGDFENDGDLDFILSGSPQIITLYENVNNSFSNHSASFKAVENGSIKWGDYDNDGDLDLLIAGWNDIHGRVTSIYRNNNIMTNTAPLAPNNLSATQNDDQVTLTWDKSSDNETPQAGLTYNIFIGNTLGSTNIMSPMADISNGYRRVAKIGNTNQNNSWVLKGLSPGKYYWGVQAIDHCFAGSQFSAVDSFIVVPVSVEDNNNNLVDNYILEQNYPNPFNPSTKIKYSIPQSSNVSIKVFDILGNEIETLVNEEKQTGTFEITWYAENLQSGVYFYNLQAGDFVQTKKMIFMK